MPSRIGLRYSKSVTLGRSCGCGFCEMSDSARFIIGMLAFFVLLAAILAVAIVQEAKAEQKAWLKRHGRK
jgi:hypothetical protein